MTPAEILDKIVSRWKRNLPAGLTAKDLDGFVSRNRGALEAIVAEASTLRRVRRGDPPTTEGEWKAYGTLADKEQARDAEDDEAVLRRVRKRMDKILAHWKGKAGSQEAAQEAGAAFTEIRAEAILLRKEGQSAVPLLLTRPALALVTRGEVVAVRDIAGDLHFAPGYAKAGEAEVRAALARVQEQIVRLRAAIGAKDVLEDFARALWSRARGRRVPAVREPARTFEIPPDLRDKKWRTEANVAAIRLVASKSPAEFDEADLKVLAGYSGWGGLSIEAVQDKLPKELVPETFGLIHEYYTPQIIADALADALCPLLPDLAGHDGIVRALEPSAGIGRLIRAFSPRRCLALEAGGQIKSLEWTAVEFSKVSAALLAALRPDVDLHTMPFERWIAQRSPYYQGTFGLVVSNPPYGERGAMAREDADDFYKEKRAYAYFMRRALDLLVPGGIGVFLVPAGLLSGQSNRGLREKLLRRHHLISAFRLPSHNPKGQETVPGASVVMDMLFWRSRGGELAEVDVDDQFILAGDYFSKFPEHILGEEDGTFAGDDEAGKARSWRYKVVGEFTGLPPLKERPLCTACVLTSIAPREVQSSPSVLQTSAIPDDIPEDLVPALLLGRRVRSYLAALGADDKEKAAQLWPELTAALKAFAASAGNPTRSKPLRELAEVRGLVDAQALLNAYDKAGGLVAGLREPPAVEPKYTGHPDDAVAQAEALFRQQRSLKLPQLVAFHKARGGTLSPEEILAAVLTAEWNLDGEAWDEVAPPDAYLTGFDLWDKYDRAMARAARGDEQAKLQAKRLLEAIAPAVFDDITDISPQHGYVPLDLLAGWLSEVVNGRYGPVKLERVGGFLQIAGHKYTGEPPPMSPETLAFLGYYNHDPELFKPPQEPRDRNAPRLSKEERAAVKQKLGELRMKQAQKWADSFKAWVAADPARREHLTNAYNRVARGRIVPAYPPEPLEIARWGASAPKLRPHQIAAARRVLAMRGGLCALDVGLGKTYTAIAIVARARQEGWVRRPVFLVPSSLVWKWHDDILCTLPDYKIAVIGSNRKRISRGPRKGLITSETDTPEERARKWIALQTGLVDAVVLSFDALARTKMNESFVLDYIQKVEAVERSIALRRRNLQEKAKTARGAEKLSERERALLEHGVQAWVQEILALPEDWDYDPGIAWDELGVDMLIVDEAAAYKNLHKAQPREDGVPKFMGGGGEGSDRAWQLDFRAAAVRKKTGGAGIVLLTATPAKNSPLEFYNLIQFIDPTAFTKAGIRDPEQFIDRFLKIEYREVLDAAFEVTKKPAVVGFKNLDDLRTLIFTYGEFRTADEVGLKLPRPVVETLTIQMDDEQEAKYDAYVKQIESILENPNPESGESYAILGLLARLSLIALHPALEDGYTYRTALEGGKVQKKTYQDGEEVMITLNLPRPTYESPKLVECAKRVAASPHCGHIIFCEPTAVHLWLREVLVQHGIPRERIAILNAEETTPADRLRISREFNGLSAEPPAPGTCAKPTDSSVPPKYDVVIANSVAYEGVDLQVRTCTIHHIDLPWTPADLEQRNGRAVRQGNTLGTVQIYYYFADGSTDGYRFSLISGKAAWLGELIRSQVRDTNNPAAQQQLTPEDILLMISRNKDKTRALLEDKKRRQAEEARAKIAKEAARLLRQANGRFRDARTSDDPEKAARLRDEGEQRLADLESISPDAWPWAPWMYAVRDTELIIPESGAAPVYEGLRIARPRAGAPDQRDYLEFGQILTTDKGEQIGLRAAGSPSWQVVSYSSGLLSGAPLTPDNFPREGGPAWPADDEVRTAAAIEKKIEEVFKYGKFEALGWRGASDAFLERYWPRFAAAIADGLARSFHKEKVPVVDGEGLAIAAGDEVRGAELLPPTRAGWQRFLELAPKSGESYTALRDVGVFWWGRKIPQDLLSKERAATERVQAVVRDIIAPRVEADPAYRNARANADEQNTRIEHAQALGRVMVALLREDPDTYSEIYKRYADDATFRAELTQQTYDLTREGPRAAPPKKPAQPAPVPAMPTHDAEHTAVGLTSEQAAAWRARLIEVAKSYRKANGERWREDDEAIANSILHDALAVWRLHKEGEDNLVESLKAEYGYLEDEFTNTDAPAEFAELMESLLGELPEKPARAKKAAPATPEPPKKTEPPRPRAGVKAVRALESRLVLPDTFTLDGQVFSDRRREPDTVSADELRYLYTADARSGEEPRRLRLVLAPRDAKLKDIDLRAELLGTSGQTSARFDWETTSLAALGKMSSQTLASLLGVPVQPFPDLPSEPEPDTADPWEPTLVRRFARGFPYRITRTRKSGGPEPIYTFAVYREGASPDRALASFDLFEEDDRPQLVDVRWLEDIRPAEQDRIRRQLDDAIRHIDHLHGGEDARDPMALMVELLEQQTRTLRARKSPPPKTDDDRRGLAGLVALLQDLADPIRSPSEFHEYLEARGFPDAAATLSAYLATPEIPLSTLVSRLWSEILGELDHAVTTVDDRGRVRLGKGLVRTDARGGSYVLALLRDDPTAPLERIALPTPVHEDINYLYFERGRPLGPGALLYAAREEDDARYEDAELFKLHDDLRALIDTLRRAPTYLADVRRALQLAGSLVDTALCQGDSRKRTLRALGEAKTLYDAARRHLTEGRTAGALERIRQAMQRIALAAVELGRACAEGEQSLPGVETSLPVLPADRVVLEGKVPDTTASALALLDQMRPESSP